MGIIFLLEVCYNPHRGRGFIPYVKHRGRDATVDYLKSEAAREFYTILKVRRTIE